MFCHRELAWLPIEGQGGGVPDMTFGSGVSGMLRWTARRKLALIVAVQTGEVDRETLQRRYSISDEEFMEWLRRYGDGDKHFACRRLRASDMSHRYAK
jgi:hypothetical protein